MLLGDLADHVQGSVIGKRDCPIKGVATLETAGEGELAFLANRKYKKYLATTQAAAVILGESDKSAFHGNILLVPDPYVAYAKVAALLHPAPGIAAGIHASADIGEKCRISDAACIGANVTLGHGVVIDADVVIHAGCVLGQNVHIGRGCCLEANVTVWNDTVIGSNALIHPGVVIGGDGFGIANENGKWIKVPQLGRVRIGDDVEIGANTTIDRGAVGDTIIGNGVKLDNLIQIGHNVHIGDHTVIAAQTGVAGSTRIGKHCAIGGRVGIVGHLQITHNVQVSGGSTVWQSIKEAGTYSSGTPMQSNAEWHKNFVRFKHLDDMFRRLQHLEKQIDAQKKG